MVIALVPIRICLLWAILDGRNLGIRFLHEKRPEPVANGMVRIALMCRVPRCQLNRDIMRIDGAIQ